jgi:hypothetical protein
MINCKIVKWDTKGILKDADWNAKQSNNLMIALIHHLLVVSKVALGKKMQWQIQRRGSFSQKKKLQRT